MTTAVLSERIPDPLTGQVYYRVSRVFPNAASASRAVTLLGGIVPQAFGPPDVEPVAQDATPADALAEMAAENQRLGLYDAPNAGDFLASRQHDAADTGEQSACIGAVCGMGD